MHQNVFLLRIDFYVAKYFLSTHWRYFFPLCSGFHCCCWEASCYSIYHSFENNVFPLWLLLRFFLSVFCVPWLQCDVHGYMHCHIHGYVYWTILINISCRFGLTEGSNMDLDNSDEVWLSKKFRWKLTPWEYTAERDRDISFWTPAFIKEYIVVDGNF